MAKYRADVQIAVDQLSYKLGYGKVLKQVEQSTSPREPVESLILGSVSQTTLAAMVLTDRRVLTVEKGPLGGGAVHDLSLDSVSGIDIPQEMPAVVIVKGSGQQLVLGGVAKDSAYSFAAKVRERIHSRSTADSSPTGAAGNDPIDQLTRLAKLRETGLLSEEEYERKRRELIDRI